MAENLSLSRGHVTMTYYTKLKKKTKCPIGPASIRRRKFPKGIIQAM
jgi:hypothetical protein